MPSDTSPLAPAVSPLLEADANSINDFIEDRVNEIFNKKPLLLSDDDLRIAVGYYRQERQRFMVESQAKANKAPSATGGRRKTPTSVSDALSSSADLL